MPSIYGATFERMLLSRCLCAIIRHCIEVPLSVLFCLIVYIFTFSFLTRRVALQRRIIQWPAQRKFCCRIQERKSFKQSSVILGCKNATVTKNQNMQKFTKIYAKLHKNIKIFYFGIRTQLCPKSKLSLKTSSHLNIPVILSSSPKFEANRPRASWVMIGHSEKADGQKDINPLCIEILWDNVPREYLQGK